MTQRILRTTLLCTLACWLSAQPAQALFPQELGKAIEKIDKASQPAQTTATPMVTGQAQTQPRVNMATCKIQGVKVNLQEVTIEDGQQVINFTLTNATGKVIEIYNFEKTSNYDVQGNQPYSRTAYDGKLTSLGNGNFKLEPGATVKCKIILVETPLTVTGLKLAQIRTQQFDNGYHDRFIEFHNVDLTHPRVVSGPFYGQFKVGKMGIARLNLYKADIDCTDYDASGKYERCLGTFDLDPTGDGLRIEQSFIIRSQISLSTYEALLDYVGGRDGCIYRMKLSYDPTWKKLKVEELKLIEGADEEYHETYLEPGLPLQRMSTR